MKKLSQIFFTWWRLALVVLTIALLAYLLFFNNLGSLLPGYAPREVNAYKSGASLQVVLDHPMNAPYKFFVYGLQKMGHHSLLVTRLVAATFAVGASLLFFFIARSWYSYRVAFFGTFLFITSAGFLHVARLGSSLILQMGLLLLIASKLWWDQEERSTAADFCIIAAMALLLYIPGMIWFEILVAVLLHKRLFQVFIYAPWQKKAAAGALVLVILAPLLRAIILIPSTLLTFAGLPQHFGSVMDTLSHIGNSLLSVGVRSNGGADLWLSHAPLLNVIELTLLGLGIYAAYKYMPKDRMLFVFGATLLSLLLIGLNGPVGISSLLPLLYLLIAGGIYELLKQWFTVFPRNPFARFTGVFFICALVFFSALYQLRAYYVAWPHNTVTKSTFSQRNLN